MSRVKFGKESIPEDVVVEARFKLAAPNDRMERITAARQAMPQGDLLDLMTILEEVLEVGDSQLVINRLDHAKARALPEVQTIKMVKYLRVMEKELREGAEPDLEMADAINGAWKGMLANLTPKRPGQEQAGPGVPAGVASPEAQGMERTLARTALGMPSAQAGAMMGPRGQPGGMEGME